MNTRYSGYKCFIIHLNRASKRKSTVDKIVSDMALETEIIDAVDGHNLSDAQLNHHISDKKLFNPPYPFLLNKGEVGCFLSHRLAWQKIVDQKLIGALIIEDDVKIDKKKFYEGLGVGLNHLDNVGYIQFQVRKIEKYSKEIQNINNIRLLEVLPIPLRTSAQIVSYEAALKLLELTKKFDRPIDGFLQLFWSTGLKVKIISPSSVVDITNELGGSTISKKYSKALFIKRTILRTLYRIKIILYSKLSKNMSFIFK